jgi:predicted amidohydrolase
MIIRSIENRIFTITANRFGTETRGDFSHIFTGASQVTAPDGTVLSTAPKTGESVAVVEIDPANAENKSINTWNNLLKDRRPEYYCEITRNRGTIKSSGDE